MNRAYLRHGPSHNMSILLNAKYLHPLNPLMHNLQAQLARALPTFPSSSGPPINLPWQEHLEYAFNPRWNSPAWLYNQLFIILYQSSPSEAPSANVALINLSSFSLSLPDDISTVGCEHSDVSWTFFISPGFGMNANPIALSSILRQALLSHPFHSTQLNCDLLTHLHPDIWSKANLASSQVADFIWFGLLLHPPLHKLRWAIFNYLHFGQPTDPCSTHHNCPSSLSNSWCSAQPTLSLQHFQQGYCLLRATWAMLCMFYPLPCLPFNSNCPSFNLNFISWGLLVHSTLNLKPWAILLHNPWMKMSAALHLDKELHQLQEDCPTLCDFVFRGHIIFW